FLPGLSLSSISDTTSRERDVPNSAPLRVSQHRFVDRLLFFSDAFLSPARHSRGQLGPAAMQPQFTDLGFRAVVGKLDLLRVEHRDVLDQSPTRQTHVHALITHAALRLAGEELLPLSWQSHDHLM